MKSYYLFILAFITATMAVGQNGTIKGTISEPMGEENVPVAFANVFIVGTTTGSTTDFDGNFSLSVPAGDYKLVISYIGYVPDTNNISINSGEVITLNRTLKSNAQEFEEFVIEAKQNRESESLLLMEQKSAGQIQQSIGAQELSAKGVSNVADGLTKVTGITKSTGNNIFVRGMGDRYNNALVNGLPIPSPNPDLKVIPLDIFPTSIVQNLTINKTFSPNLYGDFAGGTVNITTKDYPDETFIEVGAGTSVNTNTTFKPFKKSQGDAMDRFGYENGDRELPVEIQNQTIYNSKGTGSNPFKQNFNYVQTKAMPTNSVSLAGGTYKKLSGQKAVGVLVSASHSNGYQTYYGNQKVIDNMGVTKQDFYYEKFSYTTETSLLGNLYMKINERNTINFNTIYINNSDNQISDYNSQILDFDRDAYLVNTRNILRTNSLITNQLRGNHLLMDNDKLELTWGVSNSIAKSAEPDRVQLLYQSEDGEDFEFSGLNASDNHRFFSDLTDNEKAFNFSGKLYLDKTENNSRGNIEFGANGKYSNRDFWWRQINMNIDKLASEMAEEDLTVDLDNPEEFYNQENLENDGFYYKEQIDPSREHQIWQNITSAYAMVDYDLIPGKFKVIAGARAESSSQTIRYKNLGDLIKGPFRVQKYDTLVILPSVSAKYSLTEKSNLRLAASQTVSRPSMKELSPFQYQDQSGILYEGNTQLTNGMNYNMDLKYEFFPNSGEIMAVSLFGKYLKDPIERAEIPSSGQLFSYFNLGEAYVAGAEFEINKNVGNIIGAADSSALRNLTVGFNVSYLYSVLTIGNENTIETAKGTIIATNLERQMTGASPLLLNADVGYKVNIKNVESNIKLAYNYNGKKVYAAGAMGKGDIFEMPVSTMDLILKNKVTEKLSVDVSLKNLLNPSIQREQSANGTTTVINEYKVGRVYGLSLKYRIL